MNGTTLKQPRENWKVGRLDSLHSIHCTLIRKKTQILRLGDPNSDGLNLLGVKLDKHGKFGLHHEDILTNLRKRVGEINCLSAKTPRF